MSDERQEVTPEQFEVIKAVLGADAEAFKRTKVGQYIYGRIANEEEQLIEVLIEAALKSSDQAVVNIALDINMHRRFPMFVEEAIQTGHAAQRNIEQMESTAKDY